MARVVVYTDPFDNKVKTRDASKIARVNRKGVSGDYLPRGADFDKTQLRFADAGLVFSAVDADGFGGGDGLYTWDGSFARKIGFGAAVTPTVCTSGNEIVTAANRQLVMGATTIFLTAAGGVTVGTATTKPILPDGFHGQELVLHNVSSGANSITLTDVAGMALSNLKLIGATVVLAQFKALKLVFDANATAGQRWKQVAPLSA